MTKDEALKMAIEAMSCISQSRGEPLFRTVQACKEALEQPAQEPVAWGNPTYNYAVHHKVSPSWQGLSDDEIGDLITHYEYSVHPDLDGFARAIEQALKEKNT